MGFTYEKTYPTDEGYPALLWPEQLSCDITKYSITSSLVQKVTFWRSGNASRIEYNGGAVNSYVVPSEDEEDTTKHERYEIHPESNSEDELNKMVCHELKSDTDDPDAEITLDMMIPVYEDDFKEIGNENLRGQDCVKFYSEDTEGDSKTKHYLWAAYDNDTEIWQPVRYEYFKNNVWLGYVDTHDIWDFDNFETVFDSEYAFDLPEACSETVEHNMNDDAVTKDLLFIDHHKKKHVDHVFNAFKAKFGKSYASIREHTMRRTLLQKKMRFIRETNLKNLPYKLAVNHLADRTEEELKKYKNLKPRAPEDKATHPFPYTPKTLKDAYSDLPDEYDARSEGLVAPVQNQGDCGSCWTYGPTAAAEAALARKKGKLIRLSNQALIDCGWELGGSGCDGGGDTVAFRWMMKYGMPTIADYGTYEQADDYCRIGNISEENLHKIRGFVDVTPNSVGALKVALVQNGPLSVSVDATDSFLSYSSGIFYDTECNSNSSSLNHEITLVGYGEQYGETFWIVKNSYGPNWGLSGYMHILAKDNNCGIMTEPTYALV